MPMMLTPRENQILRAIVNEYLNSAQPVGSRLLWTRYGLGISPATIRSVMVALTAAGFLQQPHTSAGRVPTERAYRLFLESASAGPPSLSEQQKVTIRLEKAGTPARAARKLTEQLSEVAGGAGIHLDEDGAQHFNLSNVFGQPEFEDYRVAAYLADLLDQTKEWLPKLASKVGQIAVRIGAEHEDFRAQAVAILGMKTKVGPYGCYIAVIGPTRMPYQKITALFDYGRKELERAYV